MSQEEGTTKEREEIPPVLPVSSSTPTSATGGDEPSPTVTTVGDPGASLTQKLDTWQSSNLPEEKTYFSSDVSIYCINYPIHASLIFYIQINLANDLMYSDIDVSYSCSPSCLRQLSLE